MKNNNLYLGLLIICSLCKVWAAESIVPIVPKPKIVEYHTGTLKLNQPQIGLFVSAKDTSKYCIAIAQLYSLIQDNGGELVWDPKSADVSIRIGVPKKYRSFRKICKNRDVLPDQKIGEEGYILNIQENEIIIAANDAKGVFYGVQTLRQLARGSQEKSIPCLKMKDWPTLKYRGLMDDISRGPVPTKAFMKKQIRRLSEMKYNLFSHYVEHVVKTKSHPGFAPAGGSLSIEDWKEITDYAAQYKMEIMGSFQSLGHFEKIMAFPQYRHLGETDRMLNPMSAEAHAFLGDIYEEMIPAFSSPIFNVNCDETWDLGRGPSKKYVDSLGVAWVYAYHINALHKIVKKLGKKMLIWGDIVLEHPEILDMISNEIMMGTWTYGVAESFDHYLEPFSSSDLQFLFSCGVLNSNRLMPDFRMARGNIKQFTKDACAHGTLGMMNTVWDDGGKALFNLDWYGVAYAADHAWHPNEDSVQEYHQRFEKAIYGNHGASIGEVLQKLTSLTDLKQTFELNEAIFWKDLIPARGKTIEYDMSEWDQIFKICDESEVLLNNAKPEIYAGDLKAIQFTIDQFRFMGEARRDLLHCANHYKEACLLQVENPIQTGQLLRDGLFHLSRVLNSIIQLRDDYALLWNQENRIYWLDRNLELYNQQIHSIESAKKYLAESLVDFEKGHALPAPKEVRMGITQAKGSYFQYWLMAGPFPNPKGRGYEKDYLAPAGGELTITPYAGDAFKNEEGQLIRWFKYDSPEYNKIDLFQHYEENIEVLSYACCRIKSPRKQKVRATFGSNDGIKMVLNGKVVFDKHIKRSLIIDEDEIELSLNEGWNYLLLKIDQNNGGWGFSFRLPDVEVKHHKYKYYIEN